jgi:DNA-binding CsgD family transcriptional regulator
MIPKADSSENPKSEYRNSKQYQNHNAQNSKQTRAASESAMAVAESFQPPESKAVFQMIMNWGKVERHGRKGDDRKEDPTLIFFPDETEEAGFENEPAKSRRHIESLLQQIEEQKDQLHRKAADLREANSALKILLQRRRTERTETETHILLNLKQIVEPYLDKLKNTPLSDTQKCYLDLIEVAINNVTSPLIGSLRTAELNLTPAELQVANLVKFGRSTKEIAETSNLSLRTVESHKRNIRRKLGITNRKTTLRSFLLRHGEHTCFH